MKIRLAFHGATPLLCHNAQLADPDFYVTRQIAAINKKRKNKTEEDRVAVARLQFLGSLYIEDGIIGPVMPLDNIRKCLQSAAKATRQGKDINRALSLAEVGVSSVPIGYDGPKDPEAMWESGRFHLTKLVKVASSRVPATRAMIPAPWGIESVWELDTVTLDPDIFTDIVRRAGKIEGIGDWRPGSPTGGTYGQFVGEVERL